MTEERDWAAEAEEQWRAAVEDARIADAYASWKYNDETVPLGAAIASSHAATGQLHIAMATYARMRAYEQAEERENLESWKSIADKNPTVSEWLKDRERRFARAEAVENAADPELCDHLYRAESAVACYRCGATR